MGLTKNSVGINSVDSGLIIKKQTENDRVIALAGNPNVGKSTVFNGLTGMNHHTGNWPGKTVTNAQGYCSTQNESYVLVDIPGTYSLMAHSAEEEVARNFICFGDADAVVVVCDATCLERNLNLVLQTMEISPNVIVCVNLMDEAKRKHIKVDLKKISNRLGVPVAGIVARKKRSLKELTRVMDNAVKNKKMGGYFNVIYPEIVEKAIEIIEPTVRKYSKNRLNSRWLSLKLLDRDASLTDEINAYIGSDFLNNPELFAVIAEANELLEKAEISVDKLKDMVVSSLVTAAEDVCRGAVTYEKEKYNASDRRADKILTGKLTGYLIMICLLALVFWLTIAGANYPSGLISDGLFRLGDSLTEFSKYVGGA